MSRYDQVDLSQLDAPEILQVLGFEDELAALLAEFAERYPDYSAELESEPVVKLAEAVAYRLVTKAAEFNDGARGLLLAYATGNTLEHIAAAMGTSRQDDEDDDSLRARAQLAWEALSVAGPIGAYEYHALSADADAVKDVSVTSPVPGTVTVTVLSAEDDGTASDDLLATVTTAVNADDVRPLTDTVIVQSAEILPYTVEAVLTVADGPDLDVVRDAAEAGLTETADAAHVLGGTVSLSALYAALHVEGVISVTLASPTTAIVAEAHQAPYCTSATVTAEVTDG